MKKWFLLLATICGACNHLTAAPILLSNEFQINERFFALTSTFDLQDKTEIFGSVSKEFFSLNTIYHFNDPSGQPIAQAQSQYFTWGTTIDIHAASGEKLGWIEEQLLSWFSPSKFKVYDSANNLVANARMNFWGTTFTVTDPSDMDKEIALISRPWFQFFKNVWTVKILDPEKIALGRIDPRLLVMAAVYRTDGENRAALYRKTQKALDWYLDKNNQNTRVDFLDEAQDEELLVLEARIEALTAELSNYSFSEPEGDSITSAMLERVEWSLRERMKDFNVPDARDAGRQISAEQFYSIQKKMEAAVYLNLLEEFFATLSSSKCSDAEKGEMLYFLRHRKLL